MGVVSKSLKKEYVISLNILILLQAIMTDEKKYFHPRISEGVVLPFDI